MLRIPTFQQLNTIHEYQHIRFHITINRAFYTSNSNGSSDKIQWTIMFTRKQQVFLHKQF